MKKSFAASLIAVPLLTLSSIAWAAGPAAQEPLLLTASQMDDVTAGRNHRPAVAERNAFFPALVRAYKRAEITQINQSPVTIIQIGSYNTAIVYSGNFATIYQ